MKILFGKLLVEGLNYLKESNVPTPIEERKEILVTSKNKELMLELRNAISANFKMVWIYVHCNSNKSGNIYGIEVCNEWGSQLPKIKGDAVAQFVKDWMKEHS